MGRSPVDVVREEICLPDVVSRHLHRLARIGAQRGVGSITGFLLIGFGDTKKHPDRAHGDLFPEIGDEVKTTCANERIKDASAELPDLFFESEHFLRGEYSGEQASMDVVERRVFEDHNSRRYLDVGLDELEDRSTSRAKDLTVEKPALNVFESTDGVEVVLFVVVQRRFVSESGI